MPNPIAMIDYQKCNPERCDRVLRQEAPTSFLFRTHHTCAKVVLNALKHVHLRRSA